MLKGENLMISEKQKRILAFSYSDYDALICDGAIRSGKTRIMTVAFIDWAMRQFSDKRFGICAKTIDSAIKNVVLPYMSMSYARKRYRIKWRKSEKVLEISRKGVKNTFEVFSGKDESSFSLIQGRTLCGVMLDEVALMPKSFVLQAIARCSEEGSKLWFSCNPDSPMHWFYREWILGHEQKNALYLHFCLEDNPSLSEKTIQRYKSIYSGTFYDRYILGKWTAAQGLVYDLPEESVVDKYPDHGEYYVSCDYGTMNPFSLGLWCVNGDTGYRIAEYYHDGRESGVQLTDEEYYDALERLCDGYQIRAVVVDPSAASFITLIKRRGRFRVKKADNDVMSGIRLTAGYLKSGKLKIYCGCENALREFSLYRWDDKADKDKVIKENDHAMDDIRYFCSTVMARRKKEYRSIFE